MNIEVDNDFDSYLSDYGSKVTVITSPMYTDQRGSFTEYWKIGEKNFPIDLNKSMKQINVSYTKESAVRGCHAQMGLSCQGKLVTALSLPIIDIITDARPNMQSFGKSKAYLLDPDEQTKLWVPRGFLHSFVTLPQSGTYIFQYICDNTYDKKSEICVNPFTVIDKALDEFYETNSSFKPDQPITYDCSDKDKNGVELYKFMNYVENLYEKQNKLWYEDDVVVFDSVQ
jgi:dTDP-4-dehydrorhamnose 3,5-epimerase